MMMKSFLRKFLVAAMLPLAGTAFAGDADFTLTNKTGYEIESVYVVPSKEKTWGKDQLGRKVLGDGASRLMSFSKNSTACIYDMKIHWVGYGEDEDRVWEQMNLCEIHNITLRYNPKTNVTSMTAE